MSESRVHKLLSEALDADIAGNKQLAIKFYSDSVEEILKIEDKSVREKLNKFAEKALSRAEELKGINYVETKTPSVPSLHTSTSIPSTSSDHFPLKVSGNSNYTEEEKRVLEYTSHINSKVYVPFMSVDLNDRFHYPMPFTDKDGKLELSGKQKQEFREWIRISELVEDPKLVAGSHVDFYSIKQTIISDCSVVASLAVSALYEKRFGKRLLTSIIYPRNSRDEPIYNPSGKYTIKLHINGIPRKVIIDDYLPVGSHNQLLCSYSNNKNEFWVQLIEKAYMKVMGGYDFPGSNSNIDLNALTGWIPERNAIRLNDPDFNANAIFDRLQTGLSMGRCVMTVATGELSDVECERTGLVSTHAYAVLDMQVVDGVRLIKLKNPWSHLRWKGNYSELDANHWTPDLQQTLDYDPEVAKRVDNGIFWIDYNSILHFFDVFYLNWDPALFQYTYSIHEQWRAGIGPSKDVYTIGANPQYSLKVQKGYGSVWILLTRHITSIEDFRENKEYITLLVYKNNGKRVYYPYDPKPFIDGVRINSPHYLCKIKLNPESDSTYTLVVSQYEKTTTIFYTVRVYCKTPFEFAQINSTYMVNKEIVGEWSTVTAGGCQNHPQTYPHNPRYKLEMGPLENQNLIVELRGPKDYQVGLELTVVSLEDPTVTAPFVNKSTGSYRSGFCVLDVQNLPAGTYYLVPSTYLPNCVGPFFLTFKCTTGLKIERLR